jgi:hypothetical protein
MLGRKHIGLLLILLAVIAVMSAGSAVMAADQVPTSCTLADANGNVAPYTLSILADPATGNWPIPVPGTNQYRWTYLVSGSLSGINQLDALELVCNPEMGYSVESGGQVIAPGAGDPTTAFGLGNFQDYVVRMAYSAGSQGLPANYNFLTNKAGSFRKTSMQIKAGKSIYYCANIAGPACYQPRIATTTTQKIQLDPNNPNAFIVVTFRLDGSVLSVVDNTGAELPQHDLSELGAVNGQPVTYMPDGAIMKTGINCCYNYFINGGYRQACY